MPTEVKERVARAIAAKQLRDWDNPKTKKEVYRMHAEAALDELSAIFAERHPKEGRNDES